MIVSENVIIGHRILKKVPSLLLFLKSLSTDTLNEHKEEVHDPHKWFVVTTTPGRTNLLYIMSGAELLRGNYDIDCIRVLGIAGSRKEAREAVRLIFEEAAAGPDIEEIRDFLENY